MSKNRLFLWYKKVQVYNEEDCHIIITSDLCLCVCLCVHVFKNILTFFLSGFIK